MLWILQKNLFNERRYQDLCDCLVEKNIPFEIITVIPFSHELDPKPEVQNPICVMGATTLMKIAKSYGWGPGLWWNENFEFTQWKKYWGTELLNHDAIVCRFGDVDFEGTVFIRPCADLKEFAGTVISDHEFKPWQDKVMEYGDVLSADTMVMFSKVQQIHSEYRFFVVDGRVVTGSRYKLGTRVAPSDFVLPEASEYAQQMVDIWQPDVGFVLDIALTGDGPKIIEVNNLNSSGFYDCDLRALVDAIENLT